MTTTTPVRDQAREILTLQQKYVREFGWWLSIGEDGDVAGPYATPELAVELGMKELGITLEEFYEDYGSEGEVGLFASHLALLRHLDALVTAGVEEHAARKLVRDLCKAIEQGVIGDDDSCWNNFAAAYSLLDDGSLTVAL